MTSRNRPENSLVSDEILSSLRTEFALNAAFHDTDATFPYDNFKRLGELKLIALTVPAEHGGLGGGLSDAARLVSAVGAGEASTGLVLAMNCLMHRLLAANPPGNYEEITAAAVEGSGILNALQAEPELGSVVRGGLPGTVASEQENGSWLVNGRKAYATGSPVVRWWLTLARTDEEEARVGTIIVPRKSDGVEVVPTWNHAGLRATASHEIRLNNVSVESTAALGFFRPGATQLVKRRALIDEWACILIAALYDGIARAGRDWVHRFLHDRIPANLGVSLATVPRLQGTVGEIESLLLISRTLIETATARVDASAEPDPLHAQLVKHIVTNNAARVLELALGISGNHGLDRANPLERHYRDVLCGRVHAPQSDTILVNAGKAALFA